VESAEAIFFTLHPAGVQLRASATIEHKATVRSLCPNSYLFLLFESPSSTKPGRELAAQLTDSHRLSLSEVYECWAHARHAGLWHDVALNRLAALHAEARVSIRSRQA
jgi:hypothetical protein